ncbi:MAG: hypothetical protein K6T86_04560 [Pirellulales bacterium]|nr:hypothetical protein [Pirellulales bacterium]
MNTLIELVAQHAGLIALGSSLLLAAGALAMVCCASPAHRLRLGMLALAGVLVWLPLALIPWPRPDLLALLRRDAAIPALHTPAPPTAAAGTSQGQAARPRPAATASPEGPRQADDEPSPAQRAVVTPPEGSHTRPPGVPALPELAPGQADMAAAGVPPPAERQPALRRVEADASASVRGAGASAALRSHNAAGGPSLRRVGALVTITGSACIVWLVVGHALLARLRWTSQPPPWWLARLYAEVCAHAGGVAAARRQACLRVSRLLRRPVVCGLWRQVVLLPEAICCPGLEGLLRSVLQHELAHVRHGDAWLRLLGNIALPLLCLHPLYWWICRRIRLDSELLADDAAAEAQGVFLYAGHMIELARRCRTAGSLWPAAAGMLGTRTQFYRRMKMLMQRKQPLPSGPTGRWWAAALLGALAAVLPTVVFVGARPLAAQGAGEDEKSYAMRQELLRHAQQAIAELESQGQDVPETLRELAGRLAEPMAAEELKEAAAALKTVFRKLKGGEKNLGDKLDGLREKLLQRARRAIKHLESHGKEVPAALRKLAERLVEPATAEELKDAAAQLDSLAGDVKGAPDEKPLPEAARREKLRQQAVGRLEKIVGRLVDGGQDVPAEAPALLERLRAAEDPAEVDGLLKQAASLVEKLRDADGDHDRPGQDKATLRQQLPDQLAGGWKRVFDRLAAFRDRLARQQAKEVPELIELSEELMRIQRKQELLWRDAEAKIAALAAEIEKLRAALGKQPLEDKQDVPRKDAEHKQRKLELDLDMVAPRGQKHVHRKPGTAATDMDLFGGINSLHELLGLAERYIEAQGEVEQRREHFERIARLPEEERAGYEQTLAELEHNISVAERRARLLRAALESLRSAAERSVEAARRELEAARQAAGSGGASPADLAAAERRLINAQSTVQLLNAILEP